LRSFLRRSLATVHSFDGGWAFCEPRWITTTMIGATIRGRNLNLQENRNGFQQLSTNNGYVSTNNGYVSTTFNKCHNFQDSVQIRKKGSNTTEIGLNRCFRSPTIPT
jgi:hypothetical protein